ncbi:MAG: restriction endonuclease [Ignavibacteria bacterium]|nr:restriction endonuclease [Ignavibacteria bacterium]
MNYWTELSIQFANQRNYLDELFKVYPTIPEGIREIDEQKWKKISIAFKRKNNVELLSSLLELELFPIKDSYVAYLKRDKTALARNPKTVQRLCSRLYEMGLDEIFEKSSEPKETNRQIGPLFRRWIQKETLGFKLMNSKDFSKNKNDAILDASDAELMEFAKQKLNYKGTKGLDFVARINGRYVIGEAKFLTDFGGHQNAQFEDAKNLLKDRTAKATKIAVLDGVLYIEGKNKMHNYLVKHRQHYNIMSSLVLKEFLYQL